MGPEDQETTFRPTERMTICIKEGVFLLEAKPGDMLLSKIHGLLGEMAEIGAVWSAIAVVSFSKDEDVVTASERILEEGSRSKVYIGVMPRDLVGGRPIEIPYTKLGNVFDRLGNGLQAKLDQPRREGDRTREDCSESTNTHRSFRAQAVITVNPDICNVFIR